MAFKLRGRVPVKERAGGGYERALRSTTGLLFAVRYLKDNRLLPRGFDKATTDTDVAVCAEARDDPSFDGGGELVRFEVPVTDGRQYVVDVELRYQSIGYRWVRNLEGFDAVEPRRFVAYGQATAADSSVVVRGRPPCPRRAR